MLLCAAGGVAPGMAAADPLPVADVRQAGVVGRSVFWPVPNVDSGLVELVRRDPPRADVGREEVYAVIDAAFSQRRKMLRQALAGVLGGTAAEAAAVLELAGVAPTARGEELTIDAFLAIARVHRPSAPDA